MEQHEHALAQARVIALRARNIVCMVLTQNGVMMIATLSHEAQTLAATLIRVVVLGMVLMLMMVVVMVAQKNRDM